MSEDDYLEKYVNGYIYRGREYVEGFNKLLTYEIYKELKNKGYISYKSFNEKLEQVKNLTGYGLPSKYGKSNPVLYSEFDFNRLNRNLREAYLEGLGKYYRDITNPLLNPYLPMKLDVNKYILPKGVTAVNVAKYDKLKEKIINIISVLKSSYRLKEGRNGIVLSGTFTQRSLTKFNLRTKNPEPTDLFKSIVLEIDAWLRLRNLLYNKLVELKQEVDNLEVEKEEVEEEERVTVYYLNSEKLFTWVMKHIYEKYDYNRGPSSVLCEALVGPYEESLAMRGEAYGKVLDEKISDYVLDEVMVAKGVNFLAHNLMMGEFRNTWIDLWPNLKRKFVEMNGVNIINNHKDEEWLAFCSSVFKIDYEKYQRIARESGDYSLINGFKDLCDDLFDFFRDYLDDKGGIPYIQLTKKLTKIFTRKIIINKGDEENEYVESQALYGRDYAKNIVSSLALFINYLRDNILRVESIDEIWIKELIEYITGNPNINLHLGVFRNDMKSTYDKGPNYLINFHRAKIHLGEPMVPKGNDLSVSMVGYGFGAGTQKDRWVMKEGKRYKERVKVKFPAYFGDYKYGINTECYKDKGWVDNSNSRNLCSITSLTRNPKISKMMSEKGISEADVIAQCVMLAKLFYDKRLYKVAFSKLHIIHQHIVKLLGIDNEYEVVYYHEKLKEDVKKKSIRSRFFTRKRCKLLDEGKEKKKGGRTKKRLYVLLQEGHAFTVCDLKHLDYLCESVINAVPQSNPPYDILNSIEYEMAINSYMKDKSKLWELLGDESNRNELKRKCHFVNKDHLLSEFCGVPYVINLHKVECVISHLSCSAYDSESYEERRNKIIKDFWVYYEENLSGGWKREDAEKGIEQYIAGDVDKEEIERIREIKDRNNRIREKNMFLLSSGHSFASEEIKAVKYKPTKKKLSKEDEDKMELSERAYENLNYVMMSFGSSIETRLYGAFDYETYQLDYCEPYGLSYGLFSSYSDNINIKSIHTLDGIYNSDEITYMMLKDLWKISDEQSVKDIRLFAHNGGKFDFRILIDSLTKKELHDYEKLGFDIKINSDIKADRIKYLNVTLSGTEGERDNIKIRYLNISFVDSICLLECKLSKIAKVYGLKDASKGTYPYRLYDYLIKHNYNFNEDLSRESLIEIMRNNKDVNKGIYNDILKFLCVNPERKFNLIELFKEYCEQDVRVLIKGLLAANDLYHQIDLGTYKEWKKDKTVPLAYNILDDYGFYLDSDFLLSKAKPKTERIKFLDSVTLSSFSKKINKYYFLSRTGKTFSGIDHEYLSTYTGGLTYISKVQTVVSSIMSYIVGNKYFYIKPGGRNDSIIEHLTQYGYDKDKEFLTYNRNDLPGEVLKLRGIFSIMKKACILLLDANSLYPSAIVEMGKFGGFPVGDFVKFNKLTEGYDKIISNKKIRWIGYFKVKWTLKGLADGKTAMHSLIIKTKNGNRHLRPGDAECECLGIDDITYKSVMKYPQGLYKLEFINGVYFKENTTTFTALCKKLYAERLKYKEDGNKQVEDSVKKILNSLYGVLLEKCHHITTKYLSTERNTKEVEEIVHDRGFLSSPSIVKKKVEVQSDYDDFVSNPYKFDNMMSLININNYARIESLDFERIDKYESTVHQGGFVLSAAKYLMNKLFHKLNWDILYTDTDSAFIFNNQFNSISDDKQLMGKELGQFKSDFDGKFIKGINGEEEEYLDNEKKVKNPEYIECKPLNPEYGIVSIMSIFNAKKQYCNVLFGQVGSEDKTYLTVCLQSAGKGIPHEEIDLNGYLTVNKGETIKINRTDYSDVFRKERNSMKTTILSKGSKAPDQYRSVANDNVIKSKQR